jgi:hypothetical protein
MLDDIGKGFCLFATQISSNMAKISLNPMGVVAHHLPGGAKKSTTV